MSRAERRIREALQIEFGLQVKTLPGAASTLEIPAAHERVGPLQIQIAPDEITVFVGPAHCHFERFDGEPEEKHVEAALNFIRGVLGDRVVLWSCLGAGGAYSAERKSRFRLPWLVERFRWSGPI
jgi:hypothetical protein